MHAIRRQILNILKERSHATVAELAEALTMPPVSVRHHLDVLQGDNLIRVDRYARRGGVGRPQQVYTLTDEAVHHFPNNFAALAGTLARQIKQMLPADQVESAFRNMAIELACECPAPAPEETLECRLQRVTAFLSARGYLARWERDDLQQSYILQKYNCPYAGITTEHTELCLMDQALIERLLGCNSERTLSIQRGEFCCSYRVAVTPCELAPCDISHRPGNDCHEHERRQDVKQQSRIVLEF